MDDGFWFVVAGGVLAVGLFLNSHLGDLPRSDQPASVAGEIAVPANSHPRQALVDRHDASALYQRDAETSRLVEEEQKGRRQEEWDTETRRVQEYERQQRELFPSPEQMLRDIQQTEAREAELQRLHDLHDERMSEMRRQHSERLAFEREKEQRRAAEIERSERRSSANRPHATTFRVPPKQSSGGGRSAGRDGYTFEPGRR